jgi:exopolysaccharide biosynthesis polyprenyl glycosylphosphotransferase
MGAVTSRQLDSAVFTDSPLLTRRATAPWYDKYRLALFVTDLVMIVIALLTAQFMALGSNTDAVVSGLRVLNYEAVGLIFEFIWILALTVNESRSKRVVGAGLEEYRKVLNGTLGAFGLVAVLSYLLQIELSRFYFAAALPIGVSLLLAGRFVWRLRLTRLRTEGRALTGTLLVGDRDEVRRTIAEVRRHPEAGYKPVAVSLSDVLDMSNEPDPLLPFLPQVLREHLKTVARDPRIGAVMVAGGMRRHEIRELAWELENEEVELILVSRLTDVAGPRIHTKPVDSLPMMHVDLPQYSGINHFLKRAFDVLFSGAMLLALLPALVIIVVAIRVDDRGPAVFRQERIGQNGKPFTIHKFRTMAVNAESRVAELIQDRGGNALLFKMKDDPRVTRVGRILRKYSLDELPQFWDVLRGSMSVVGPRPQVAREVEQYQRHVYRRLLTKPGITGLWQVSGRSELSIDESIRLDLNYVENWSISGDIMLILKTIRAVLRPSGAY